MEASDKDVREIKAMFLSSFAEWQGRKDSPEFRKEIGDTVVKIMQRARVKKLLTLEFKPFRFDVFPMTDNPERLIFDGADDYSKEALQQVWFLLNKVDDPKRYKTDA